MLYAYGFFVPQLQFMILFEAVKQVVVVRLSFIFSYCEI